MTMQQLSQILRLAYHATQFGDPHLPPFNYTVQAWLLQAAEAYGHGFDINAPAASDLSGPLLTAAYVTEPKPKSPFPSRKPKPPVLQAFSAKAADYKEYCDPFYLQNPYAFPKSIPPEDPCYHTFTAKVADLDPSPKKPLLKGITEQAFWQCSQRSKTREYLSGATVANNQKMQKMLEEKKGKFEMITLGVELAAALVGMIPWGSYAQPGSKGAEEAQQEIEQEEEEVVEQEVEQQVSQAELAATLEPLMESFLHAHEKHNAFTMLHLKALDQTDYAVNLAHNFSQLVHALQPLVIQINILKVVATYQDTPCFSFA
eukprot:g19746.t1